MILDKEVIDGTSEYDRFRYSRFYFLFDCRLSPAYLHRAVTLVAELMRSKPGTYKIGIDVINASPEEINRTVEAVFWLGQFRSPGHDLWFRCYDTFDVSIIPLEFNCCVIDEPIAMRQFDRIHCYSEQENLAFIADQTGLIELGCSAPQFYPDTLRKLSINYELAVFDQNLPELESLSFDGDLAVYPILRGEYPKLKYIHCVGEIQCRLPQIKELITDCFSDVIYKPSLRSLQLYLSTQYNGDLELKQLENLIIEHFNGNLITTASVEAWDILGTVKCPSLKVCRSTISAEADNIETRDSTVSGVFGKMSTHNSELRDVQAKSILFGNCQFTNCKIENINFRGRNTEILSGLDLSVIKGFECYCIDDFLEIPNLESLITEMELDSREIFRRFPKLKKLHCRKNKTNIVEIPDRIEDFKTLNGNYIIKGGRGLRHLSSKNAILKDFCPLLECGDIDWQHSNYSELYGNPEHPFNFETKIESNYQSLLKYTQQNYLSSNFWFLSSSMKYKNIQRDCAKFVNAPILKWMFIEQPQINQLRSSLQRIPDFSLELEKTVIGYITGF